MFLCKLRYVFCFDDRKEGKLIKYFRSQNININMAKSKYSFYHPTNPKDVIAKLNVNGTISDFSEIIYCWILQVRKM